MLPTFCFFGSNFVPPTKIALLYNFIILWPLLSEAVRNVRHSRMGPNFHSIVQDPGYSDVVRFRLKTRKFILSLRIHQHRLQIQLNGKLSSKLAELQKKLKLGG